MSRTMKMPVAIAVAAVGLSGIGAGVWASTQGSTHSRTSPAVAATRDSGTMMGGPGSPSAAYPGGMMGSGYGGWMGTWMGGGPYGLAGNGQPVRTLGAARARAQAYADRLGLRAGEVLQFANGYYAGLATRAGRNATEVLVDPADGSVSLEYGPAMMWNTVYGMHPEADAPTRVSAARAHTIAQTWLRTQNTGLTAEDSTDAFPGYYTLETLKNGRIAGMMSVNAVTGAVWFHTWHGRFIAISEK